jgi:hypothetical protein
MPGVLMLSFAYLCITYVCGPKRVGIMTIWGGVELVSCTWGSLAKEWDSRGSAYV